MFVIVIIILAILLFGGGGYGVHTGAFSSNPYYGGGIGILGVVFIVVLVLFLMNRV